MFYDLFFIRGGWVPCVFILLYYETHTRLLLPAIPTATRTRITLEEYRRTLIRTAGL